jgi:hypothetical protein
MLDVNTIFLCAHVSWLILIPYVCSEGGITAAEGC